MEKKKLFVRLIVPVLIAVVIAVIWIVKTRPEPAESDSDSNADKAGVNADFILEADSIDLETLTAYGLPIIIDFGADSCEPCKKMAPVLKALNEQKQGEAIIKFVDVWKYPDAADNFPIQVIPTQVFINADGTPYTPSDDINVTFDMYGYQDTGEHAFTVHQGYLSEDDMRTILADMGAEG